MDGMSVFLNMMKLSSNVASRFVHVFIAWDHATSHSSAPRERRACAPLQGPGHCGRWSGPAIDFASPIRPPCPPGALEQRGHKVMVDVALSVLVLLAAKEVGVAVVLEVHVAAVLGMCLQLIIVGLLRLLHLVGSFTNIVFVHFEKMLPRAVEQVLPGVELITSCLQPSACFVLEILRRQLLVENGFDLLVEDGGFQRTPLQPAVALQLRKPSSSFCPLAVGSSSSLVL